MLKSMPPLIAPVLALTFVFGMSMTSTSLAQEKSAGAGESALYQEMRELDELATQDELPPPAEAPYPGSPEVGFESSSETKQKTPATSTETTTGPSGAAGTPPPPVNLERPIEITEDGEYLYGTDVQPSRPSGLPGIVMPAKTTDRGEFIYDTDSEDPKFSGRAGTEAPVSINARGEYFYQVENSPTHGSFSIRGGAFTPPQLQNQDNGVTFEDMYGSEIAPMVFFDIEWLLTERFGNLGLKLTSGVFARTANGRFKDPARATEETDEEFTFLMLPNQLTAVYKFRYWDNQLFTPYIEGGGGYFTFAEFRDDGKSPRFGAAPAGIAAAGLHVLLDWIDPQAIRQLDVEWGVNHVWLTLEFRSIVGLDQDFDFSSQVMNAGFTMEF